MSNIKRIFSCLGLLVIVTGCVSLRSPLMGAVYSDMKEGMTATSLQRPSRVGEACAMSILGLYAAGDATINTARNNGRINTISSVDDSFWTVLGIYSKYCVTVRGN